MPENTAIVIEDGTTSIGNSAFSGCIGLTSVTIPNSVTTIGNSAFYGCSGLTSVTIPNSVISIGSSAFSGCSGLTSIIIPNSVTSIGRGIFPCNGLTNISVESGNSVYDSRNNCNAIIETATNTLIQGCQTTTIPESVTSIGSGAFSACLGLTFVTIPESVNSIGNGAFWDCDGLTSVTIPESVTSIGNGTFSNCSNLTSITIPNSVTFIGSEVFYFCESLTSVTIPNSVKSINFAAFCDCYSLTSVIIPNSVTSIDDWAFRYCSGLTSVTIPNSVKSIGDEAFIGCRKITDFYCFAEAVPTTSSNFFDNNNSNATLHVPASVIDNYRNSAPWSGFRNIVALSNEEHPISFEDSDVQALCMVNWDTDRNGLLSYAEAAAVTDLGEVFADNKDITSFDELQYFTGLTAIGDNAFMGCSNLASVSLPENITSIGAYAFYGCKALTTFTIPQGVSEVGAYAFRGCTGLIDMYCLPLDVPTTASNAFNNSNIGNATLHVVSSSYNAYKNAEPWKNFKNMLGDIPVPCAIPTISYVEGKVVFACDTEDVEFKSNISSADMGDYNTSEIDLCVAYDITVYATKEGYTPSKTATAILCWIDSEPVQGVATEMMEIPAVPVLVKSHGGVITVEGVGNNTMVSVYTTDGMLVGSATAVDRTATIATTLTPGTIAIVKIGEKAIKVVMH